MDTCCKHPYFRKKFCGLYKYACIDLDSMKPETEMARFGYTLPYLVSIMDDLI